METLTRIRKEYKTYNKSEFLIDVYSDRVCFLGFNQWLISFFERRNVVADFDRSGVSINIKDAVNLGLDLAIGSYLVSTDLRKKIKTV